MLKRKHLALSMLLACTMVCTTSCKAVEEEAPSQSIQTARPFITTAMSTAVSETETTSQIETTVPEEEAETVVVIRETETTATKQEETTTTTVTTEKEETTTKEPFTNTETVTVSSKETAVTSSIETSATVTVKEEQKTTTETTTKQEETVTQDSSKNTDIPSTEKTLIQEETKRRVVLNVKNIQQLPELPAGCEITSTTIALNYLGFNCDKISLLDYMPIMKGPDKNNLWASPWDCFVGSPYLTYYGCYSPVIKTTIEAYFSENQIKDWEVIDLRNSTMEELYKQIDDGYPVIVWATISMSKSKVGNSWYLQDGSKFTWTSGEHCLVLIGYDLDKNTVILSDPYDSRGTVEYSTDVFEARYKELYEQALVVRSIEK